MGENQLVDHRHKSYFYCVVPYILHGTAVLVLNMGIAAPRSVFVGCAGVYPALEGITAFAADDLAGKTISALVFITAFDDAFFLTALLNQCVCRLKDLTTDDGFVVICHQVLILLAVIDMTVKPRIGVCLLKDHIAGVFFIADHIANCCRRPASSLFNGYALCIQFLRNGVCAFAGKHLFKNPADRFCLFRIDDHLLAVPIVAIRWVAELEGAILEPLLDGPFAVLGNGCRLSLCHAA